jgi:hypothetical protein
MAQDFELIIERVAWPESGRTRAASTLRRRAKGWRRAWVLVQYTALAWSARGFPLHFLRVEDPACGGRAHRCCGSRHRAI